jgi:pimeloyl-ACP methyl ester carboxylesterase
MQLIKINIIFESYNIFPELFVSVMEQLFFTYKNSSISYIFFGNGPAAAICFHGYGESALNFSFLGKYLDNQYTFYCIDLPFHGKTEWNEGLDFSMYDLDEIVSHILIKHQPGKTGSKLTLFGYSLGGRAALCYLQIHPAQIDKIVLLAPDGLKVNGWYWLATQTWLGNQLFSLTMKKPGWFFGLLRLLNKLRLVNSSIFKFVNYYIGDEKVRQLLYKRWTTLRKLKPDLKKIKEKIRNYNIPARLIYGKHDRIILSIVGENFRKGIETHCIIYIIHSGHQVLHEKHMNEILPALSD